ncbi:MAG: hypothetical protein LBE61_09815 [Burkholderiaceae bacterium]|nr:hypothetical protein [Burkholderiaceae bacterium]
MNLRALIALAIFALGLAAGWAVNGWRGAAQVADCKTEQAQGVATRAEAVRQDETQTAAKEHQHAASTITISDTLTTAKSSLDDQLRAELANARRLQLDATRRAATYRAQAQADAQARSDLADRSEALDRQLAAGLGVVAELRADLGRRDAEVSGLCDLANADAVLLGEPGRACAGAALKPGAVQGLRLPQNGAGERTTSTGPMPE